VLNPDTDGDGASDAVEVAAGTDPLGGLPLANAVSVPSLPAWGLTLLAGVLVVGAGLLWRRVA
jgi:hypothetical protein